MALSATHSVPEEERMPAPTSNVALPYLRAWRLHRLMTVRGLAEKAGVGFTTVARIEHGFAASAITAIKLARALDVTVRDLKDVEPQD